MLSFDCIKQQQSAVACAAMSLQIMNKGKIVTIKPNTKCGGTYIQLKIQIIIYIFMLLALQDETDSQSRALKLLHSTVLIILKDRVFELNQASIKIRKKIICRGMT